MTGQKRGFHKNKTNGVRQTLSERIMVKKRTVKRSRVNNFDSLNVLFFVFRLGQKTKQQKKRRKTDHTQGLCLLKDGNERRVAAVRRLVFMEGL